jgi:hypothetical protein
MSIFSKRSYWIPGSSAPTWSEKGNAFVRPLTKKGFKEERVTTMRLDDLGTSTTLESDKSQGRLRDGERHVGGEGRAIDDSGCGADVGKA